MKQTIEQIEATPALVVDLPQAQRNLEKLANYAKQHRIGVRPHTKTHKSRMFGGLQLDAGAIGLTVAKVGEAEVMSEVTRDILVAYPASDPVRTSRIADLAKSVTMRVALDSAEAIENFAVAARSAESVVGVLIDLDIGFHRTGAQSPAAALELAQQVARNKSLRLDGVFFYPGHVWSAPEHQSSELEGIDAMLSETIELWKKDGLAAPIVSGGSTPTTYRSHLLRSQTEIRPGTYVFNDMNTARAGFCQLDECAAKIVCTVISTTVPGKVVIDGGTKTFTSDRNIKFPDSGHGYIVEYPNAQLVRLSEEHGELDVSQSDRTPRVGERISVIPNHICPCVNLQNQVWIKTADRMFQSSDVDARGKLI